MYRFSKRSLHFIPLLVTYQIKTNEEPNPRMFSPLLTEMSGPAHDGSVDLYRHQHFFKPSSATLTSHSSFRKAFRCTSLQKIFYFFSRLGQKSPVVSHHPVTRTMIKLENSNPITNYANDAKKIKILQKTLRLSEMWWNCTTKAAHAKLSFWKENLNDLHFIPLLSYNEVGICCNESLHNALN